MNARLTISRIVKWTGNILKLFIKSSQRFPFYQWCTPRNTCNLPVWSIRSAQGLKTSQICNQPDSLSTLKNPNMVQSTISSLMLDLNPDFRPWEIQFKWKNYKKQFRDWARAIEPQALPGTSGYKNRYTSTNKVPWTFSKTKLLKSNPWLAPSLSSRRKNYKNII